MQENIFTVDQVAGQLTLHPKTIRRFIQEGVLKAHKVGKQWRILSSDLRSFMGSEFATGSTPGQSQTGSPALVPPTGKKIQVSTVLDLYVKSREDADRTSTAIMAALNSKDQTDGDVRCDYIFYTQEGKARFVLYGAAKPIGELLIMLAQLSE